MDIISAINASAALPEATIALDASASIHDLPSEILSDVAEILASKKLFSSLLELRLAGKSIGDVCARVLLLRAERRVWTVIMNDVNRVIAPLPLSVYILEQKAR
jgi:hypothetical protein